MDTDEAVVQHCLTRPFSAFADLCGQVGSCSWAYTVPVSSTSRCLQRVRKRRLSALPLLLPALLQAVPPLLRRSMLAHRKSTNPDGYVHHRRAKAILTLCGQGSWLQDTARRSTSQASHPCTSWYCVRGVAHLSNLVSSQCSAAQLHRRRAAMGSRAARVLGLLPIIAITTALPP